MILDGLAPGEWRGRQTVRVRGDAKVGAEQEVRCEGEAARLRSLG